MPNGRPQLASENSRPSRSGERHKHGRRRTRIVQTEASEREAIERFIRDGKAEPRADYELAIEFDGAYVGVVHLAIRDRTHRRGEIGFVLRQSLWGRGIVAEAASALVRFGFDQFDPRRIEATCQHHLR